jgi:hypothetical protein
MSWLVSLFFQDLENPEPFIRSHGPRSLYEKFLPGLRDWFRKLGVIKKSFSASLIRKREIRLTYYYLLEGGT